MVIDTSAARGDVVATRREITLQKQIIEATVPVIDRYGSALDVLQTQLNKKLITLTQYTEANRQLRAEFPQNVALEQAVAAGMREVESATRSLMSAEDILADKERTIAIARDALRAQWEADIITLDEYQSKIVKLDQSLPSLVEKEKALAAARDKQNQVVTAEVVRASPGEIQAEKDRAEAIARGKMLQEQWLPVSVRAKKELAEIKEHHLAGRVGIDSYRNAQIQLTAAQLTGIPIIGRFAATVAGVNPAILPIIAGMAGWAAILKVADSALDFATAKIKEQYKAMSELVNRSQQLSIPVGQFQAMAHSADIADMSVDEFSKGYETMLSNISKAAAGKPKALEAFDLINVDAKRLKDQQPDEILRQVTEGLGNLTDASDRVRAATGIFGDTDFLRLNVSDLMRANQILGDTRGRLTELDKSNLGELSKATKELQFAFDAIWKRVAADLAPALTDAASAATDLLLDASKNQEFVGVMREATDYVHGFTIIATGVPSLIMSWAQAIESANPKLMLMARAVGVISGQVSDIGEQRRLEQQAQTRVSVAEAEKFFGHSLSGEQRATAESSEDKRKEEDAAQKAAEDAQQLTERLQLQVDTFGMSSDAIAIYNSELANNGRVNGEARQALGQRLELERQHEAEMKAAAEALKKKTDAEKKAREEEERRVEASKSLVERLTERAETAGMTGRQKQEREIDKTVIDPAARDAAKSLLDRAEAASSLAEANKKSADTVKDLEKQIRQSGMTAEEKRLDDLAVAGVDAAQLSIIDTLQKELALREQIHETLTATSSVMKAGSREAADAIASAERAAITPQRRSGSPIAGGGPVLPVVSAPIGAVSVPTTATPKSVAPVIIPAVSEQMKAQQQANAYLKTIAEKPLVIEVEEYTL